MVQFTISFTYQNRAQKAGVLRSITGNSTEYDVRPVNPSIVRKFGKQIRIIKNNKNFNTINHIDKDYAEFFNCLVNAIRKEDEISRHLPESSSVE
jgi:hypothetical protein